MAKPKSEDNLRPKKRSKTERGANDTEMNERIEAAWEHYRNYIDSASDNDNDEMDEEADGDAEVEQDGEGSGACGKEGGDIDELLELFEVLSPLEVSPLGEKEVMSDGKNENGASDLFPDAKSLLPILLSMSYLHLASHAISFTMFDDEERDDKITNNSKSKSSPEYNFQQALRYWPSNPAANSLLANYHRMNLLSSTSDICDLYVRAAKHAGEWRQLALEFLQDGDEEKEEDLGEDDEESSSLKEWVELLVMNGALGVDYIGEENEEEEEEVDISSENSKDEEANGEEYSSSEVEATASFMSALLLSTLGRHDEAIPFLKKFHITHRIHPRVWESAQCHQNNKNGAAPTNGDADKANDSTLLFPPRIYHGLPTISEESDNNGKDCLQGILPPTLYQRMCDLFAPDAPYWKESDYQNRGYYSYFIDFEDASNSKKKMTVKEQPTNVIEDVIVNHLLPLAEKTLKENHSEGSASSSPPDIVGAEWWAHTRPLGANLGHQIHFDTDESLLGREKKVTHPIVSSVLYLTGGECGSDNSKDDAAPTAGSTIVFDQTPDSKEVASKAWIGHAKNNTYMNFPGNLLHGVLPCVGSPGETNNKKEVKQQPNRLTFMVGFWTRNVPEGMGNHRKLYGPCGPLPPATKEHSWVIDSQKGYDDEQSNGTNKYSTLETNERKKCQKNIVFDALPCTFPAWERIDVADDNNMPLVIPKGLDHRYFVQNAPHCFSDSLFEKDECF